ncbi:antibiotic biosynthesis monooxygenase [Acinetobacter sp. ANC 4558]|uniref:antibiotic biosynthesis monooxygenase family protein n=1 Tax=Acinetobacter sp. ANC 4558 TaxID=1977876 RepID=UPI000A352872|nr:antibiotic biosynthesis monooxygenase [Acinetobacter sp. ANC 4558]OTG80434.1 antibiotic biosynthesis monooxygenase [Acinetobacter sp. ANC 4558]
MKYVVIFKASIRNFDHEYNATAENLRNNALQQFNCQKFESFCLEKKEFALSYWNSLEDIRAWRLDTEHQLTQQQGKEKWYHNFEIEICEIQRQYKSP